MWWSAHRKRHTRTSLDVSLLYACPSWMQASAEGSIPTWGWCSAGEPVATPGEMKTVFQSNNPSIKVIRQGVLSGRCCHSHSQNPVPYLNCLFCKFFLTLIDFMTMVVLASFSIQDHRLPKTIWFPGLQTCGVILLLDCHQSHNPWSTLIFQTLVQTRKGY